MEKRATRAGDARARTVDRAVVARVAASVEDEVVGYDVSAAETVVEILQAHGWGEWLRVSSQSLSRKGHMQAGSERQTYNGRARAVEEQIVS